MHLLHRPYPVLRYTAERVWLSTYMLTYLCVCRCTWLRARIERESTYIHRCHDPTIPNLLQGWLLLSCVVREMHARNPDLATPCTSRLIPNWQLSVTMAVEMRVTLYCSLFHAAWLQIYLIGIVITGDEWTSHGVRVRVVVMSLTCLWQLKINAYGLCSNSFTLHGSHIVDWYRVVCDCFWFVEGCLALERKLQIGRCRYQPSGWFFLCIEYRINDIVTDLFQPCSVHFQYLR